VNRPFGSLTVTARLTTSTPVLKTANRPGAGACAPAKPDPSTASKPAMETRLVRIRHLVGWGGSAGGGAGLGPECTKSRPKLRPQIWGGDSRSPLMQTARQRLRTCATPHIA